MTTFKTISSFRRRIEALLSVRRRIYAGVVEEIRREFCGQSIETIRRNNDIILLNDAAVVVKLRLPDKQQHLSKSNGYRLIYLASKISETVVFLDIYPKRGPMQQINIDRNTLKQLLLEVSIESRNNTLHNFDMYPS